MKVRAFNDESKSFVSAKLIELENMEVVDERGFELSWFFGLFNRNAQHIYTGDILATKDREPVGIVKLSNGSFRIDDGDSNHANAVMVADTAKRLVTIGNIYQNPELIENNN